MFFGENLAIHYNIFITISCFDYFVLSRCSCLSREVALLVRFPKINLSLVFSEQFSNQLFTYRSQHFVLNAQMIEFENDKYLNLAWLVKLKCWLNLIFKKALQRFSNLHCKCRTVTKSNLVNNQKEIQTH